LCFSCFFVDIHPAACYTDIIYRYVNYPPRSKQVILMRPFRKTISVLLCACILLAMLPAVLLPLSATVADDLEEELLGTLSARYESNSDPGAIAEVAGDPGGKSYGTYMLASRAGSPKSFFEWCQASENMYYKSIGDTLSEAYYYGNPGYGTRFDAAWKQLAKENADGFARAQHDFIRATYYDRCVSAIAEAVPSFSIANYSIALRNVLWSRAVQHGVGGAVTVVIRALETLGGFVNQQESELINAIYAESGRLVDDASPKMSGSTARNYGVEGLSLAYYTGCSADVQLGVYIRLRINEPANAQAMLAEYGYGDAPLGEGSYLLSPAGNENLAMNVGDKNKLTISAMTDDAKQQFRLVYYASGCYTITGVDSGLRLTAASGSVKLAAATASDNQLWVPEPFNSGFLLRSKATGQYLSADSFSAGGTVTMSEASAQWQLVPGAANWTLTGASYPTYANGLQVGSSSFPFRGTLRSTYPITKVRSEILNSKGTTLYYSEAKPNAVFYDLSKMDKDMAFSKLKGGSYTLLITADDTSGSHYELREPFFVSDGTYTATLDPGKGTCDVTALSYEPGQVFGELPTAKRSGYSFVGWYDEDGNRVTAASTTPARNMVLTAKYAKLYTYTFLDHDEETVVASGKLIAGKPIPLPDDPTRPNDEEFYYTFSGWQGYTPGMEMGKENVTFVAQYDAHPLSELTEMAATGSYRLVDGYLRVIPAGTTAEQILDKLTPRDFITIRSGGEAVTGAVATGMTVEFAPAGEVTQSVAIVVTGDVNGDSAVTLTDMVQIRAHLLSRKELKGAYLEAADLNGDGNVTLTDFVQSLSAVLGRSTIQPN